MVTISPETYDWMTARVDENIARHQDVLDRLRGIIQEDPLTSKVALDAAKLIAGALEELRAKRAEIEWARKQ